MPWVRLDDGFPEHPKLRAAGPLGRELFVAALCHSNRYLTDGRLTMDDLRRLGQYEDLFVDGRALPGVHETPRVEDVLERLVFVGAMHFEDGYAFIHDYDEYQVTRRTALEQRAKWREAKRRQRAGDSSSQEILSSESPGRGSTEDARTEGLRNVLAREDSARRGTKRGRRRDPGFEALLEVCGIEAASLTESGRGAANRALRELNAVGATPEEIRRRSAIYRGRYTLPLTPSALAKHWGALAAEQSANGRGVSATEIMAQAQAAAREALPS